MQSQLQDWRATASEIQGCDLIISVDTAIAHLAGALGRDVWLLNRFGGDWRWLGPRWYRNVTISTPRGRSLPARHGS
ncbi:MAG: glycosyltransferase family 9 protein [Acetobacteraceae bacterium]